MLNYKINLGRPVSKINLNEMKKIKRNSKNSTQISSPFYHPNIALPYVGSDNCTVATVCGLPLPLQRPLCLPLSPILSYMEDVSPSSTTYLMKALTTLSPPTPK